MAESVNKLDRIRAFLHSADAAEDEDEEIKVWVKQVRERYGFKELGLGPNSRTKPCYFSELRNDARLLEDDQLVGIESQKQHLLSFLMENTSQLLVAAVVGMGGLGKTTLVNTVYDAWEALKVIFRNNNNGSRIIITARIALVASSSTKDLGGESLTLNPLSSKDSWALFCAKAFQGSPCPSHLEEISRNVLKRCEGLPLAIVAIGSMLATKDMNRVDEFEIVERSLQAELYGNKKLKGMQAILSLSLNDLPYHLKHCLMYLSLFPEDYLIKHNVLIRLWISEGFIEEIEGRSLEEVGHGCFNELINRSLLQVTERYLDGRVNSCRVHDILRETMLLKSKDQSFATITNKESSRRLPKSVRRLCVHEGTKIDTLRENQLSQLRSFLVFTKEINVSFSQKGSRLVKVLDCTSVPMTTFPKDITKLYHLRYLCLRDTNVSSIPPSIANLRHLETLDLKNTFVQELPKEILSLECLRHVLLYDYKNSPVMRGFKALKGIDSLSSLRKLNCVEAKLGDTEFLVSIGN
uniref:Disease resistance protein RPM1 n=1 Tax=Cannabis sativa TaxID=3483 RepID=A0A803QE21_CANSA